MSECYTADIFTTSVFRGGIKEVVTSLFSLKLPPPTPYPEENVMLGSNPFKGQSRRCTVTASPWNDLCYGYVRDLQCSDVDSSSLPAHSKYKCQWGLFASSLKWEEFREGPNGAFSSLSYKSSDSSPFRGFVILTFWVQEGIAVFLNHSVPIAQRRIQFILASPHWLMLME